MTDMPNVKFPLQTAAAVRATRWEYMTLTYNYAYGTTTYEINGEKEVRLKNKPLHETLSLFGQQGWELIGVSGAEGKLHILKRPAQRAQSNGEGK